MSVINNKKDFFKAAAPCAEDVEIGGGIIVKMHEMGADDFVKIWMDPAYHVEGKEGAVDLRKITPILIVASVVDEKGKKIFDDADAVNLEAKVGSSKFIRLSAAARRINGLAAEKN